MVVVAEDAVPTHRTEKAGRGGRGVPAAGPSLLYSKVPGGGGQRGKVPVIVVGPEKPGEKLKLGGQSGAREAAVVAPAGR